MTLSWSLDKVGPICRSAADAATVFAYIHGTDDKDASAVNAAFNYNSKTDVKTLRIGYAKNHFDKLDSSTQEWSVLKALKAEGLEIKPMYFPDTEVYAFDIIGQVIGAESAAAFDAFTRTGLDDQMTRQTRFDWPNYFRVSRTIPAVEYINAQRHRYVLMQKVNEVVSQYDAIICPSRGGGNQSAITNLTGHPVVCVPTGLDAKSGLPTGISFVGKLYDEGTLLRIAQFYQDHTTYEETHPQPFL
jgi:Asp-tRNA(Asn)/Glu-tRNA(Gln) amidotransferase A subunit family amidase